MAAHLRGSLETSLNGYNLPLAIAPAARLPDAAQPPPSPARPRACGSPGCTFDLARCAAALRADGGAACWSACDRLGLPAYCCTGAFAGGPTRCPSNPYAEAFKAQCPTSYSYAYDDRSSTYVCRTGGAAGPLGLGGGGYTLTFCPRRAATNASAAEHRDREAAADKVAEHRDPTASASVPVKADASPLARKRSTLKSDDAPGASAAQLIM